MAEGANMVERQKHITGVQPIGVSHVQVVQVATSPGGADQCKEGHEEKQTVQHCKDDG